MSGLPADVTLRPATAADVPTLAKIVSAAYGHYVERIGYPPRPMTQDYAEVLARFPITVAERGGRVAGLVVHGEDEEGYVVDNVAVDPRFKGSGVGGRCSGTPRPPRGRRGSTRSTCTPTRR